MKKWPTLKHLSEATLEDVHKVWSGLGYYSRGQRLLEGAKKIQQLGGHLPKNAKQIQDTLPGISYLSLCTFRLLGEIFLTRHIEGQSIINYYES